MSSRDVSAIPLSLQQAVEEVFQVQINTNANVESVSALSEGDHSDGVECMSVLGMKDKEYQGSLALGFPKRSFLEILEAMIGERQTEINAQNVDACGELLNIIYASARVKINQAGFEFEPSIPATVQGKDITVALGSSMKAIKIKFNTNKGPFILALSLRKTSKS